MINAKRLAGAFRYTTNESAHNAILGRVREAGFTHTAYGFTNPLRDAQWRGFMAGSARLQAAYEGGRSEGAAWLRTHP